MGWLPLNDSDWEGWRSPEGAILLIRSLSSEEAVSVMRRDAGTYALEMAKDFFQAHSSQDVRIAAHNRRIFEGRPLDEVTLSILLPRGPKMSFTVVQTVVKRRHVILIGTAPADQKWASALFSRVASSIQAK
jgi:hypothetical protein